MKKIFKIAGALFFILIATLFNRCRDCGSFPNRLKTIGLEWGNYKAIYYDKIDEKPTLLEIENDTVDYNEYSIFIVPKQEMYFAQNNNYKFNIIKTANACSPIEPISEEKIDSIVILSDKNFDKKHLAGSNLSNIFDIVVLTKNEGYKKYNLDDYVKTKPNIPNDLILILNKQPVTINKYEFLIKWYQNGVADNNYFEFKTKEIVIK